MAELSSLRPDEQTLYAVRNTSTGNGRVTTIGLTVQKDTTATVSFRVRVKGVDASKLAEADAKFVATLTPEEKKVYDRVKSEYKGGLSVPWFWWIGLNLDEQCSKEKMDYASKVQPNYNAKAAAAKAILDETNAMELEVSGELSATGTSMTPTTVYAFIKFATVTLDDGSELKVLSNSPDDLVAVTGTGMPVSTTTHSLKVVPFEPPSSTAEEEA